MKTYQVKVLSFAYEDIDRAKSFYDNQSQNLGRYFTDSILTDLESLSFYGGIHSKSFGFLCFGFKV